MRDFFKTLIQNMKAIAGINQLEIMAKDSLGDQKKFQDSINFLLDELCNVSRQFGSMPEEEQQKAIKESIMTDKDFRNLNVRWLYGLLSVKTREYLITKADSDRKREEREIRESTGCDAETAQKYLNEWKQRLSKLQENMDIPKGKGTGSRLRDRYYNND